MAFPVPSRLAALLAGGLLVAVAVAAAGVAVAQTAGQGAAPRPVFCIANQLVDTPVQAEIRSGQAVTRVQLPSRQEACCVKFCGENPAPYQVAITVQPTGGIARAACKATVRRDQLLTVGGTPAQTSCTTGQLPQ